MNLSFKTKILLLVVIPLLLISVALTALTLYQTQELGHKNVASFSDMIFKLRRNELKNYTELALTSIKHIYGSENNDVLNQKEAKAILKNLSFGKDGYFFVYDYEGTNVAHPKKPQLEGKNLYDLQDSNGVFLIRSLIQGAKTPNGDYTEYVWDKPSKGGAEDKIGFSMGLDKWQWMVGTGLYVDDLQDAVVGIQTAVNENIYATVKWVVGLALALTIGVGLIVARYTLSEGKLADNKLRELSHKVVQGQEEERARVSHSLQKEISHELKDVLAKLKHVASDGPIDNLKGNIHFIEAFKKLNQTTSDVYRIAGELRPEVLDKYGLVVAVERLCESIESQHGIEMIFKKTTMSREELRPEVQISLYRIVQAALSNVVKHSEAGKVVIRFRQTSKILSLHIQDDGKGFDTKNRGLGLYDMRIRAEALGGVFHLFSTINRPTVIKVDIPL